MLEKIQEEILRLNPEGFPVPRFAGERELGDEYRGKRVAVWDFLEFKGKALCVPFSVTATEIRLNGAEHFDELAGAYADHVVRAAREAVEEKRQAMKSERRKTMLDS